MNSNSHAVFCSNNETLKFIDLESGNTEILTGHTDIIITIDKFKNFILTGSKDNECRLWHYNPNAAIFNKIKCVAVFKGHTMNISCVNFSPKKGYQFVSSSEDNTIKVWNVKQLMHQIEEKDPSEDIEIEVINQAQMTVMAHQKTVNVVKFSPNGKIIASASQDKTIKIWSAKELKLLQTLKGHISGIWDLDFSKEEKQLISCSGDKLVKIWDISTEKASCISTFQGHNDQIIKCLWLNAGLQIATASVDGVVKLWNVKKQ